MPFPEKKLIQVLTIIYSLFTLFSADYISYTLPVPIYGAFVIVKSQPKRRNSTAHILHLTCLTSN